MSNLILAAGAVVWRKGKDKVIEVALIHRPKYKDWSLPKGKLEIGESLIACAHREVLEETNIETEFGPFLGEVKYLTPEGDKSVTFWSAKVLSAKPFHPNGEVDQLQWLSIKKALQTVNSATDKKMLERFSKLDLDSTPLILLRHAKAISRDEWQGDDDDRPLDSLGTSQAKRLLPILKAFNLQQIHTSDAIRCYDTIYPTAKALELKLEVSNKLSESSYKKDKEKAIDYAKDLMKAGERVLLCSHNPILPKILDKLSKKSEGLISDEKLLPAGAWVIHRIEREIVQVDHLEPPSS